MLLSWSMAPYLKNNPVVAPVLAQDLHHNHQVFRSCGEFQSFITAHIRDWPRQVQQGLELIALHGIRDPLTGEPIAASDLELSGVNYRESLAHQGVLSRHRAVLFLLQDDLNAGLLPPPDRLRLYCPEAITPFAQLLRRLVPHATGSEYLPDPLHPLRGRIPHQDLCALTFADASFDLVLCNELFEHLYNLPVALQEIARVLAPGGVLLSTFPFAYGREQSEIKAIGQPQGAAPELIGAPEFHGNPVDNHGSLVYQIPGWEILDQARAAGFQDVAMHWLASPSYGILGQELPGILVLQALR